MILKGQFLFFLFLLGTISVSFSQVLVSGKVTDERNDPIPYSKIYLKNMTDQRTICDVN